MQTREKRDRVEPRWASLPLGRTRLEMERLGGVLAPEEAQDIQEAIEEACEQIEGDEQQISA